jgi:DNA modification methylase
MTVVFEDPWLTVLHGDVRAVLPDLDDASIDAVITSPPYWQQRSYLEHDDPLKPLELGQEATFADWLSVMASICLELRRVLKPNGSLWLVLGDKYVAYGGENAFGDRAANTAYRRKVPTWRVRPSAFPPGLRRKSLLLAPYRLAMALEEAGWILRDRIVWLKTNGIPESVGDRFHVRDEVIFRFTPERFAYFDVDAVRQPYSKAAIARSQAHRAPTFAGRKGCAPGQPPRHPKIWTGDEADAHRTAFVAQGDIRDDGSSGTTAAVPRCRSPSPRRPGP